jgi:hypothetical protein
VSTLDRLRHIDLKNGVFNDTRPEDLDALFAAVDTDHLVVHFHGGLVSRRAALETADHLLTAYTNGGTRVYPVFFVWHSGFFDVVGHNLAEIAKDALFAELKDVVWRFVSGKIEQALEGGDRSPAVQMPAPDQVLSDAEVEKSAVGLDLDLSTAQAQQLDELLEASRAPQLLDRLAAEPADTVLPEPLAAFPRGEEERAAFSALAMAALKKGAFAVVKNTLVRLAKGTAHGLHATVVEELLRVLYVDRLGGGVWTQMKQDTRDAFGDDPARYGGTAFLQRLDAWWRAGRRVTLVGHSTGAVYILNLLDAWRARVGDEAAGRKFEVVFLAGACTARRTLASRDAFRHVGQFRAFAMDDAREKGDQLLGDGTGDSPLLRALYPRSLLYFVSGVVEEEVDMPLVGMARFFGEPPAREDDDVANARAMLSGYAKRFVWAADGMPRVDGEWSDARDHGGMDNDEATLASVRFLFGAWA